VNTYRIIVLHNLRPEVGKPRFTVQNVRGFASAKARAVEIAKTLDVCWTGGRHDDSYTWAQWPSWPRRSGGKLALKCRGNTIGQLTKTGMREQR
jgi:hypothetical protein